MIYQKKFFWIASLVLLLLIQFPGAKPAALAKVNTGPALDVPVVPPNDNMANATVISTFPFTDSMWTTEATLEVSEPTYTCGSGVTNTVWYTYTNSLFLPVNLVVDNTQSTYHPVIHVFNAATMDLVACDDLSAPISMPRVTFTAEAGNTYLISIGANWGNPGMMNLNIVSTGPWTGCGSVDVPQNECEAVSALYTSTNGSSWYRHDNWFQNNMVCTWYGIACWSSNIETIYLSNNWLNGPFAGDFSGFPILHSFLIHGSPSLSGDLSTILGYMPTSLGRLGLTADNITGTIPPTISNLSSLTRLYLYNNSGLSGPIPIEITNLAFTSFTFYGTSLCEPADSTYISWKATVSSYSGSGISCNSNLFVADFETADLSQWSSFNDGGGFLYACAQGAINGAYGACVERGSNNNRKQLIDQTPADETVFSARFNFDVNSLSMGLGEPVRIMQIKMGAERPAFLVLQRFAGGYAIQLNAKQNDLSKVKTAWITISDAPHTIEVDWTAGAGTGFAKLYVDDVEVDALTALNNDSFTILSFRMGFTSRLAGKSISGIFYIDDVATGNQGNIGLP